MPQPTASRPYTEDDALGTTHLEAADPAPRQSLLRRLLGLLSWLVVVASAVALLVFGIGPQTGAYRTLTVLSNSMKPTFQAGDVVIATAKPPKDVRKGDVIIFTSPATKAVTTHRVYRVLHGGDLPTVATKGDNNNAADPFNLQLQGNQLWYMRASVPKFGYVIQALRKPWMMILAMSCLGLLAVTWMIRIWFGERVEDEEEDSPEAEPGR